MADTPRRDLPDRLYARFGWKVWPFTSATFWLLALVVTEACSLNLARIQPTPPGSAIRLALLAGLMCVIGGCVSTLVTIRFCAPLRRALDNGADLVGGWNAVISLPIKMVATHLSIAAALGIPTIVMAYGRVYHFQIPVLFMPVLGLLGVSAAASTGLIYFGTALVRPFLGVLHDLGAPLASQTVTLRSRLLLLIPTLSIGATATGAGFAQATGSGVTWSMVAVIIVTTAFGCAVWTPIGFMFAHSMLTPLKDLQAATERIKRADYTQPVPETWGDELGAVATSINEAMAGLAERQRMAREVRESRARIVAASDASRKRIERNIHDGAQQRLVALALDARLLESQIPTLSGADAAAGVRQLAEGLKEALAELRDLARGLHPAVLSTDGLAPALQQLATRAKIPVVITVPKERFPEQIETTAYFVSAEALANIAKYARATTATVTATRRDGHLSIEIVDDGVGGASASNGSGLSGLADRVAAIGGRFTVDSPQSGGTRITADLPLNGWQSNG
ncbi:sensor histidine kinase [Smaragdicoccus niigatensis]|uniref:sensor histidine kinase n=1 Tax=Smaragdicoccus niigatensis TaxID=359359 RepID=UPI00035F4AEA|nr:histidine kinase [Smaragdicoccus niigatensis]